jgi:nitroreductase
MRTAFACREFTDEPVTDEDLVGLLELARFAPSGNRQGWRVVVVDQATKDELVELSLPALRLYVVQRAAGENPWNTIVPSAIDPASIDHRDDSGVDWFRVLPGPGAARGGRGPVGGGVGRFAARSHRRDQRWLHLPVRAEPPAGGAAAGWPR